MNTMHLTCTMSIQLYQKVLISTKSSTVTDTLESVLAIADTPVACVDGRDANGSSETSAEGNTVTVKGKISLD